MDSYEERFKRNQGVFSSGQQERIREARILIVGSGGIGSLAAEIFARCGVGDITIVDFDRYDPSNCNRQIHCRSSTLGLLKAEVAEGVLREINPGIRCRAIPSIVSVERARELIAGADLVFPAADDLAYSLELFRIARELGKPALLVVPFGFWGIAAIQAPAGKTVLDLFGIPRLASAERLREAIQPASYRIRGRILGKATGYSDAHLRELAAGEARPSQVCPAVWSLASMGVLESVKYLAGKYESVALPSFYEMSSGVIRKRSFYGPRGLLLRLAGRVALAVASAASP